MIDPDWLARVLALAEADTGGLEPGALAALLAEPGEVLPYLFVHGGGFADWPKARAALAKASASVIRESPGAAMPAPPAGTVSPHRDALYAAQRSAITGGDTQAVAAAMRLVGTVRVNENRGDDAPSLFIERD